MSTLLAVSLLGALAGASVGPPPLAAPGATTGPDSAVVAFLEAARAATARYHDVEVARLDGFRPVGPDFPGMGEHWIRVSSLLDGRFDGAAPAVLSYAPTPGGRALVGVAYALPLAPGELPPAWPVPADYWHVHAGSLDEESLVLHHLDPVHHDAGHHPELAEFRLAILHAWIWLENPAGTFVTDNWALPWFRAGLEPGPSAPLQAAWMVAFASGAEAYYLAAARALARLDETEAAALAAVFGDARDRVLGLVRSRPAEAPPTVSGDFVAALLETWGRMWREAADAISESSYRQLEPLRGSAPPETRSKIGS